MWQQTNVLSENIYTFKSKTAHFKVFNTDNILIFNLYITEFRITILIYAILADL